MGSEREKMLRAVLVPIVNDAYRRGRSEKEWSAEPFVDAILRAVDEFSGESRALSPSRGEEAFRCPECGFILHDGSAPDGDGDFDPTLRCPNVDCIAWGSAPTPSRSAPTLGSVAAERDREDAKPTRYTVGSVEDAMSAHLAIQVEYAGKGRWAVRRASECLSRNGEWEWEPQPSSRTDEWLTEFRFTSHTDAIRAARAASRVSGASDA